MFDVIVISHGGLSKALVETAQMVVGEQEAVETFGLYLGDSVDLFREKVVAAIGERLKKNDVLVLTDMQSGSPFNTAVAAMGEYEFRHFTGMNLPMLLEVFCMRPFSSLDEVCDSLVEKIKETVLDVNEFLKELE